jgi:uncharacterized protein (TIGR00369 family)
MTPAAGPGPIPFPREIPFAQTLGLQLWAFGDGMAELRLPLNPGLMNSMHVSHGGVLMTMLDVVMAHAARSADASTASPAGPSVVTIEMKTSFMRPAAHGPLRALGKLLHGTATLAFTEAHILDSAGLVCAHATGTFKLVRPHARAGRPHDPVPSPGDNTP